MNLTALGNLGDRHIDAFRDHLGPDIRHLIVLTSIVLQKVDARGERPLDRQSLFLFNDVLGGV